MDSAENIENEEHSKHNHRLLPLMTHETERKNEERLIGEAPRRDLLIKSYIGEGIRKSLFCLKNAFLY